MNDEEQEVRAALRERLGDNEKEIRLMLRRGAAVAPATAATTLTGSSLDA